MEEVIWNTRYRDFYGNLYIYILFLAVHGNPSQQKNRGLLKPQ